MFDGVGGDNGHILLFALDVIVKGTGEVITATGLPISIPDPGNIHCIRS